MGLEFVELILRVEETFKIWIPDEEAAELTTVDKLYCCVLDKTRDHLGQRCLTSVVFYRVRQALMAQFQRPRHQIRPATALEELFSKDTRRALWASFKNKLQWSIPALARPAWVSNVVGIPAAVGLFGGLAVEALQSKLHLPPHIGLMMCGGGILWGVVLGLASRPLATCFPRECASVGDLSKIVLGRNAHKIIETHKEYSKSDVWTALKVIIVEELGVKPEEVVPEARFNEDFNAG